MAHSHRLNPWIGGENAAFTGRGSPLISPVDETAAGEIAECNGDAIDRAVALSSTLRGDCPGLTCD